MKGAEGLQGSNQQMIWGGNNMFNKMKKLLSVGAVVASAAVLLTGCGGGSQQAASSSGSAAQEISGKISASGSTALLPLLKPAQEAFQDKYEKVTVNVAGGGSFTGMNQVAEGSVQIGNSDVNLPDEYKDKGLVDHKVVVEPFVFIVDKANRVDNLTKQQAIDILTGKITNWKEVGGDDQPITLIHRAKSSGSRATIADVVLKGASFTVSNIGVYGIESFTPVVNPPQTGILGVCAMKDAFRMVNGQIEVYPSMNLSLSYDHRALDGSPASKFLKDLKTNLENYNLILAKG